MIIVMVSLQDYNNTSAPPLEVALPADSIILIVEKNTSGQAVGRMKLSDIFGPLSEKGMSQSLFFIIDFH